MTAVTRSGGAAPFTVHYSTSGGTATPGSDYVDTNGTLTFAAGVMSQTDNPNANDNFADEDAETLTVPSLRRAGAGRASGNLGDQTAASVTIADNDTAGVIQLSSSVYRFSESAMAGIVVRRTGGLASGATVHYTTTDAHGGPGSRVTTPAVFRGRHLRCRPKLTAVRIVIPIVPDTFLMKRCHGDLPHRPRFAGRRRHARRSASRYHHHRRRRRGRKSSSRPPPSASTKRARGYLLR